MSQDYHSVLGLNREAKQEEIKKAYRKKAMEFHPDKNASAGAQEKFIEITEAYHVLVGSRPVKQKRNAAHPAYKTPYEKYKNVQTAPTDPFEYQEWLKAVREKAWRESGMPFNEFKKKNAEFQLAKKRRERIYMWGGLGVFAVAAIAMIIYPVLGLAMLLISSATVILKTGVYDPIMAIVDYNKRKHRQKRNPSEEKAEKIYILQHFRKEAKWGFLTLGFFFSVFSIIYIGNRTLISLLGLLAAFLFIFFVTQFPAIRILKNKFNIGTKGTLILNTLFISPFILTSCLWINYLVNYRTEIERHRIDNFTDIGGRRSSYRRFLIDLEGNSYSDYDQLRTFEPHQIPGAPDYVEFKFGEGMLGFRVMKDYTFRGR
jgi:hypothetical protein